MKLFTETGGEWSERRGKPEPDETVYYYSEHHDALLLADVWLWQVGNTWRACPAYEISTWWEGGDPVAAGAPVVWWYPITQIPEGDNYFWWTMI